MPKWPWLWRHFWVQKLLQLKCTRIKSSWIFGQEIQNFDVCLQFLYLESFSSQFQCWGSCCYAVVVHRTSISNCSFSGGLWLNIQQNWETQWVFPDSYFPEVKWKWLLLLAQHSLALLEGSVWFGQGKNHHCHSDHVQGPATKQVKSWRSCLFVCLFVCCF